MPYNLLFLSHQFNEWTFFHLINKVYFVPRRFHLKKYFAYTGWLITKHTLSYSTAQPHLASFLFIFILFKHKFYRKNCRLQCMKRVPTLPLFDIGTPWWLGALRHIAWTPPWLAELVAVVRTPESGKIVREEIYDRMHIKVWYNESSNWKIEVNFVTIYA